ncbi:unnamed protein product [Mycena citricolor]|uniref:RNA polymerase III transcription factor IIIC subunit-domain-containing protein n=1 Tax=Mycena citricolor TaxID=2018698 RepID=A0AAD2HFW8_9AGAR|nr:unnamed protein product [Mycena citricolor]
MQAESEDRSLAPEHPIPNRHFFSVEYPGYVRQESVPIAIQNLGGQAALDNAFKRRAKTEPATLELKLRPGNPFAHPIPGDVVSTNNLVLKIVKRRRKNRMDDRGTVGEYTAEIVGAASKTVRFRSMADYQYQPDANDPVTKLRTAMDIMDGIGTCSFSSQICSFRTVETLRSYSMPAERAEYLVPVMSPESSSTDMNAMTNLDPALERTPDDAEAQRQPRQSNLRLFPPPLFSRQALPQPYNFKANPASMVTSIVNEETGEERKRLINKMRWKGFGPISLSFSDRQVTHGRASYVERGSGQKALGGLRFLLAAEAAILKEGKIFTTRPVWTRAALLTQLTPSEAREATNTKALLPTVCYVFSDGPWRDTLVRFGYDPRQKAESRFYQRVYFRNVNHPIVKPSVMTRRQDRSITGGSEYNSIVDGSEKDAERKETASFQLCDLHDSMLQEMIEDESELREECDERDGWYTTYALERIKTVLRHKFFTTLEGYPATDEECRQLLVASAQMPSRGKEFSNLRNVRLKLGKHNMAKGALRPEDAAALRLRAALDKTARDRTEPKD